MKKLPLYLYLFSWDYFDFLRLQDTFDNTITGVDNNGVPFKTTIILKDEVWARLLLLNICKDINVHCVILKSWCPEILITVVSMFEDIPDRLAKYKLKLLEKKEVFDIHYSFTELKDLQQKIMERAKYENRSVFRYPRSA